MAHGYFFVDPRSCEEVLYVPGVMEVRCFRPRGDAEYTINFNVDILESYAIANSRSLEEMSCFGAKVSIEDEAIGRISSKMEWGPEYGVPVENLTIEEIYKLCRERKKEAMIGAMKVFNATIEALEEASEDSDNDAEADED
tara:strand:+ start:3617 stop:4039 length:423 start_codon:yes stop_codon:yes gene_type:complete